jgi:hypothetical protein
MQFTGVFGSDSPTITFTTDYHTMMVEMKNCMEVMRKPGENT